jgi:hypothetical protein
MYDMTIKQRLKCPPGYDRDNYNRGWKASAAAAGSFTLDNADGRGEPNAWYDGYYDLATGREKWHLPNCKNHHNNEGGCGWA